MPLALIAVALVLVAAALAGGGPPAGGATMAPGEEPVAQAGWKEVDRLIDEQKYQKALETVRAILERATDPKERTRAILKAAELETGLGGFEMSVRFLRSVEWPAEPMLRAQLELAYAGSLQTYLDAYSWEIGRREEVVSRSEVDLARWTRKQILAEIDAAFTRLWKVREILDGRPLGEFRHVLEPNTYPRGIRDTVRDAVTYLWADHLANSSYWLPGQEARIYTLDLERLAAGEPGLEEARLADPAVHPLERLAAILGDLERWHAGRSEPEAALEAFRTRIERLDGAVERREDHELLRRTLARRLERTERSLPWWSWAQATLAEMTRSDEAPDALVRVRRLALEGIGANPGSPGAQRCRAIVAEIERPGYSLQAMTADAPHRRSLRVTHKNLERLHFRAWRLDLREQVLSSDDWNLLPRRRAVEELAARRAPHAEWTAELPPTPDYRDHVTYVTPPMERPGLWVILASARPDFRENGNTLQAVNLVLGDPVLLVRQEGTAVEAEVRSGSTGKPLAGARVELYRLDWRHGHRLLRSQDTGPDGTVRFSLGMRESYFLLAEHDGELALDPHQLTGSTEPSGHRSGSLLFTDRAIYRPGQTLHFKVVVYEGDAREGSFQVRPSRPVQVRLLDANGKETASARLVTNSYGSADGSFVIPAGRMLGSWRLTSSAGGSAAIRVEEYKRPTFRVEIPAPEEPLRLNREARLTGEARYYFGLPVAEGKVSWRVERVPVWPRWFWWWYPPRPSNPEVVAAGETEVDGDGRFTVRFTPAADEREAATGVSYRFRLTAEVTDPGGETRSAERSFRLGFVTVEAAIEAAEGFLRPGSPARFTVHRSTLDGRPAPGNGRWRLVRLDQPRRTLLPADIPFPSPPDEPEGTYHTEGDRLRPRWQTDLPPERILASWDEGETVRSGRLEHDEGGTARIELAGLEPGAYRLVYETEDPFGATATARKNLVVARTGGCPVAVPLLLELERATVPVGGTVRLLVYSGLPGQELVLETFRSERRIHRRVLRAGEDPAILTLPVSEDDRGGLAFRLTTLADHQLLTLTRRLSVPWDDKKLEVELGRFRDTVRPGARESFTVTVRRHDGTPVAEDAAELLASMYDASLDLFADYTPPDPLALYPDRASAGPLHATLGSGGPVYSAGSGPGRHIGAPGFSGDRLRTLDRYGIGGMGHRGGPVLYKGTMALPVPEAGRDFVEGVVVARAPVIAWGEGKAPPSETQEAKPAPEGPVELRSDFAETALWQPHLLTGADGSVTVSYEVPDSVTEWNLWVWALTRHLEAGSVHATTRSVKDLMVRPYLPRFFREGDRASIRVEVNNAGETPLSGTLDFQILDPDTEEDLSEAFGLDPSNARGLPFSVEPGKGTTLEIPLQVPARPGLVAFKVTARANGLSDGELRPLPVLPGRYHLMQSRFVTLEDDDRRELRFPAMADTSDPTRIDEQLVVTVDAQLFTTVLRALPYLVRYPYECTEQTMNRFLSTAIVGKVFERHPSVAEMARRLAAGRDTRLERWDRPDPNRKMLLEETPWLVEAEGGAEKPEDLIAILDPEVATANQRQALSKLAKAQTSSGGFPWWPGGPPSPYMTCYILDGFARALDHGVEVPRDMVVRAWRYLHRYYLDELVQRSMAEDCCWEMVTYLGYILSRYPDESWTGNLFSAEDRQRMLDFSFRHWKQHSPRLKGYLALTLERAGRHPDARLVFDSVLDSARRDPDLGVYWQPEARSWLWYNDTTESHAMAIRVLLELDPDNPLRRGLVQWLLLDKKLNHWKSTRATAEVIYALVESMERDGDLGARQRIRVEAGPRSAGFDFEPDRPVTSGQLVIPGPEMDPTTMSRIEVESEGKGFAFATATWHFSTEKEPERGEAGTLFGVERTFYRRVRRGSEWVLEPLAEGARLEVGDQVEVELRITARHQAEYIHLRDPRGAGFEPETLTSGYRFIGGLGLYEEIRDSGANFFIEWLPAGEYTLRHRLRATTAGRFRIGPATLQAMYAPEHGAYSAGAVLEIGGDTQ